MSIFDRELMKQYTDSKFGQIDRIEVMADGDPVNPQERVLYFVPKGGGGGMPVTDYLFRFDAMQLDLSDGANVSLWPDLSGNGNDLSQANEADQPVFLSVGLNGKPTVQFSNTFLDNSPFSLNNVNGATAFLVAEIDDTSSSSVVFTINDAGSTHSFVMRISGSNQYFGAYINTWSSSSNGTMSSPIASGPVLYSATYDEAAIKLYEDGSLRDETAYTEPIGPHNLLRLGKSGRSSQPQPYYGKISELIYFSRALSTTELNAMHTYIRSKWGV